MSLEDKVVAILAAHVGRHAVISSSEIAHRLHLPESADRTIRNSIADEDWEAREMLVVAIPGIGFYVANDIVQVVMASSFIFLKSSAAINAGDKVTSTAATTSADPLVTTVSVKAGQAVKAGDVLLSIEAMKMETVVTAPRDGEVAEILVAPGAQIDAKDLLVALVV